jgi:hypothetical protein
VIEQNRRHVHVAADAGNTKSQASKSQASILTLPILMIRVALLTAAYECCRAAGADRPGV